MKQTVYKSGSSLVVVVPSEFIEVVGVKTGDFVNVRIDYDKNCVIYQFTGVHQLTFPTSKKMK